MASYENSQAYQNAVKKYNVIQEAKEAGAYQNVKAPVYQGSTYEETLKKGLATPSYTVQFAAPMLAPRPTPQTTQQNTSAGAKVADISKAILGILTPSKDPTIVPPSPSKEVQAAKKALADFEKNPGMDLSDFNNYDQYKAKHDELQKAVETAEREQRLKELGADTPLAVPLLDEMRGKWQTKPASDGLTQEERNRKVSELESQIREIDGQLARNGRGTAYLGQVVSEETTRNLLMKRQELNEALVQAKAGGQHSDAELLTQRMLNAPETVSGLQLLLRPGYAANPAAGNDPETVKALNESTRQWKELEDQKKQMDYFQKYDGKTYDRGFWGQSRGSYDIGRMSQDSSMAWNDYLDNPTAENRKKAETIDQLIAQFQQQNADTLMENGKFSVLSKDIANYLPQFFDQQKHQLAGRAIAVPLAIAANFFGLPADKVMDAGAVAGSGAYSYNTMRGSAFKALLEAGVDEETARKAANDEAVVSSAIEMADTALGLVTKGGGRLIDILTKGELGKLESSLEKLAGKNLFNKFAVALGKYGLNIAGEALEEGTQGAVSIANRERDQRGVETKGDLIREAAKVYWDAHANKESPYREEIMEQEAGGGKIAAVMGLGETVVNRAMEKGLQHFIGGPVREDIQQQNAADHPLGPVREDVESAQSSDVEISGPVGKDVRRSTDGDTMISKIYNGVISDLQAEYDAVTDKTSTEAKNILDRIETLKSELASVVGVVGENSQKNTAVPDGTTVTVKSANSALTEENKSKRTVAYTLASNIDSVRDMRPVSNLTGTEFKKLNGVSLPDQIKGFFKSFENKVFRKGFGDVELSEYGVGGMMNHRPLNRARFVSLAAVPDVIKSGRQIDYVSNWKGRGYETYTFAAPVTVNETTVYVAAVVNKNPDSKFYLSEMVDSQGNYVRIEESPSGSSKFGATDGAGNPSRADAPMGPEGLSEESIPSAANAEPTSLPTGIVHPQKAEVNQKLGPPQENVTPQNPKAASDPTLMPPLVGRQEQPGAVRTDAATVAGKDAPIQTVKDRLQAKLGNSNTELENIRAARENSNASFDRTIAELGEQYDSMKNQDPKAAGDILRRIESLRRQKAGQNADYARRIADIEQQKAELEKASAAEGPNGQKAEAETKYSLRDAPIPTRENLNQKPPMKVVDISKPKTTGTFKERRGDIIKNAQEAMKKPYLNRDTGKMVFITEKGINHSFSNNGEIQMNAVEHLPELIESAVLTHHEQPTHGSQYTTDVYTFFAAAQRGDTVLPVKIKVMEYAIEGQELPANIAEYFKGNPEEYTAVYDSKVLMVQEIEENPRGSGPNPQTKKTTESRPPQELSTINVSDLLDRVKGDAEKYVPKPKQTGIVRTEGTSGAGDYKSGNRLADSGTPEQKNIARVLDQEPTPENRRSRAAAILAANVLDKGLVFENLSLKTGNRELQGKWNYILSAASRAQYFIGHGEENVKPLYTLMNELSETGKTKQFSEYLYHLHNVDRMTLADRYPGMVNKPVFGDTVTAEQSRVEAQRLAKANPEFEALAKDVYAYNNELRKMMVDNGLITQHAADLWAEMYPNYVPIRRAVSDSPNSNMHPPAKRARVNPPIKGATGGNSDILPLFDTMAKRTIQTFEAVAKNNFGTELRSILNSDVSSETATVDGIIDSLDTQGRLLQNDASGKNPTFTVFENGERVTFKITQDMYEAMQPASELMRYRSKLLKGMSGFHRNLLTQYNPIFAITNAIKDNQEIIFNSQHPLKTQLASFEAMGSYLAKGYWYTEYMKNGGGEYDYFDRKTNTFQDSQKSALGKVVGFPLKVITEANDFIETRPRLAEYIASRKEGRSVEVSMLDAARVTTNFAAGGDFTKFLNGNGCTFLNASVQGAMQQVRNVREAYANGVKGWVGLAARYAVAGIPGVLLNALLWKDDEDYEELSDYVKDNYYVLAKKEDGRFIKIPKGRTEAVIQNAIQQIIDTSTGDDQLDLRRFLDLAANNLAPNNPIDNNVIAPIVQAVNNRTWFGEELVPERMQNVPAKEQFDETTDKLSVWLGDKLNVSPMKINYLLDQYSGGVGDLALPMLTPQAENGEDSILGNLVAPLKDKFSVDSVLKNQNIADFRSVQDKLTVLANSREATDEDKLRSAYMSSVNGEMSDLYTEKREIQNSDLSDKEKYEQVREIQKKINDLAEGGLDKFENVSIQGSQYAEVGGVPFIKNSDGKWEKASESQLAAQKRGKEALGLEPGDYWDIRNEVSAKADPKDASPENKLLGQFINGIVKHINDLYYKIEDIQAGDKPEWQKQSQILKLMEEIQRYGAENKPYFRSDLNVRIIGSNVATIGNRKYYKDETDSWSGISNSQQLRQQKTSRAFGISESEYWKKHKEYDFAYSNIDTYNKMMEYGISFEEYSLAGEDLGRLISKDPAVYEGISDYIYNLDAKDADLHTKNGLKKERVTDYIWNKLNVDDGIKMILYKQQYPNYHKYDHDIVVYLNQRPDVNASQMKNILLGLGALIDRQGNIKWDW